MMSPQLSETGSNDNGHRNDLRATITSLSHDGRGVARVDGKVIFIDGALPGEEVIFRYRKRRKKHDIGMLIEIVSHSPDRVTPPCEFFTVCGGCGLQHLDVAVQIHEKEKRLRDHLTKFGDIQPEQWLAPLSGENHHYRRKARLGARYVLKKGGVLVGFREKSSSYIADMQSCVTLEKRFSDMLPALRELLMGLSCREHIPQIELAAGDTDMALVFRHLVPLTEQDEISLKAFGQAYAARIYCQPKGPDSIVPLWPAQDVPLSYRLAEFDIEMLFRPVDFVQVNADMNQRMVSHALALLDLCPQDRVLDLFCGLGNFTLPVARHAAYVIGVEANDSLLEFARLNARSNGIDNVEYRQADLYDETVVQAWPGFDFNKLLLDPPRDGAMQVLKQFAGNSPERIVYVSCNPVTLARDSEYLVNVLGYRMIQAGVMDMFPHTNHVESIAVFVR